MPLSWNEIKSRALAFSKQWKDECSEDAEAKSFWDGFFDVFGISRKRVASFEEPVKKMGGKQGFIDLFWKGVMLVEHKSRGRDLDKAYTQALDYFAGIPERDLPKYVLVSDFARFRLYNLESSEIIEFALADFYQNIRHFGFIAGYQTHKIGYQDPVNIKAAEQMGKLHDQMKAVGYEGHPLEVYLVRLLFCVFAEDTGIFERQQFQDYIENHTASDGSDLGHHLNTLFYVLNTPGEKRLRNLDEDLGAFAYINGQLFEEMLPPASFDTAMRQTLLDCCALDWSRISPAIFGSLFQSIMDKQARRNLGAHYTSEENILKLIGPLFLDELRAEFEKLKATRGNKKRLEEFHKRLGDIRFLDPACGCGNFLVITYRELRLLELEVLRELRADEIQGVFDISNIIWVDIEQFYGIEIEEFPARIAEVALWLVDHQINMLVSQEYGQYFARIPLKKTSHIVNANALRVDWPVVDFILGNPPFLGKTWQSKEQREDLALIFSGVKNAADLDFVACWHWKAAQHIRNSKTKVAFVSTNSITQGEQVPVLWKPMLSKGIKIHFAHRTFRWSNDARGVAAVHCVIIGFGAFDISKKQLFEYANISDEASARDVSNISPYLTASGDVVVEKSTKVLSNAPKMGYGSKPTDAGNFFLTTEEKSELEEKHPSIKPFIKRFVKGNEFINGLDRYCLWLVNCPPSTIASIPEVMQRIKKVKETRLASTAAPTRKSADYPSIFFYINQPTSNYLILPGISSENRKYIPIGFLDPEVIAGDNTWIIPNATLYEFGIVTSEMHMTWMRTVTGRIKSDYQYSASMVYNNFPWPTFDGIDDKDIVKMKSKIEECAQSVLDARAQFPDATLADLYDPLTMPPVLLRAHQNLDKAVDKAYGKTSFASESERVAFLFERYQELVNPMGVAVGSGKKGRK